MKLSPQKIELVEAQQADTIVGGPAESPVATSPEQLRHALLNASSLLADSAYQLETMAAEVGRLRLKAEAFDVIQRIEQSRQPNQFSPAAPAPAWLIRRIKELQAEIYQMAGDAGAELGEEE